MSSVVSASEIAARRSQLITTPDPIKLPPTPKFDGPPFDVDMSERQSSPELAGDKESPPSPTPRTRPGKLVFQPCPKYLLLCVCEVAILSCVDVMLPPLCLLLLMPGFDLCVFFLRTARARFDCDAEDVLELSFKKDQILLNGKLNSSGCVN